MTAAVRGVPLRRAGLRAADPRHDLPGIAALIEQVFGPRLDWTARRMLRDMRRLGRFGWWGWAFGALVYPRAHFGLGYVWDEGGRVVGNTTLFDVEGHPERWVLANVAVDAAWRRRGIGRALVLASIERARARRARSLLLQVEPENLGARALYRALGFRTLITRTAWERPADAAPPPAHAGARPRRREEWREHWQLAARLHPEGLVWPAPPTPALFRPPGSLGLGLAGPLDWVWPAEGPLQAGLSARPAGDRGALRLVLACPPAGDGQAEAALLARALRELAPAERTLRMDYPAGLAIEALRPLGFAPGRTLTWMEFALTGRAA